jgi:ATP-dependent DNA helicase RecG
VEDLLWHLPWRYDDLSQVKDISALEIDELTTVRGRIELLNSRRARRRRLTITEALVTDITGSLKVIWFNQPYINKTLKIGDEVLLAGKVSGDLLGRQMNNPSYEKVSQENIHTARLVPIYPATEKLTQKQLRFLIKSCLPALIKLKDWLPEEIKQENKLIDLNEAIEQIHFPDDAAVLKIAQERLQFDEMFLIQIYQQWARKSLEETLAPALEFKQVAIKIFVAQLPFTLTDDQRKAAWEILRNLGNNHPMNRLLDGDVGSGKTVVAALAAYNVALNDSQVALMAPTAILARQQFTNHCRVTTRRRPNHRLLTLKTVSDLRTGKATGN